VKFVEADAGISATHFPEMQPMKAHQIKIELNACLVTVRPTPASGALPPVFRPGGPSGGAYYVLHVRSAD